MLWLQATTTSNRRCDRKDTSLQVLGEALIPKTLSERVYLYCTTISIGEALEFYARVACNIFIKSKIFYPSRTHADGSFLDEIHEEIIFDKSFCMPFGPLCLFSMGNAVLLEVNRFVNASTTIKFGRCKSEFWALCSWYPSKNCFSRLPHNLSMLSVGMAFGGQICDQTSEESTDPTIWYSSSSVVWCLTAWMSDAKAMEWSHDARLRTEAPSLVKISRNLIFFGSSHPQGM